jgi:hypothetical protein
LRFLRGCVPVVLEDDDGNWLVKPDGSPAVRRI